VRRSPQSAKTDPPGGARRKEGPYGSVSAPKNTAASDRSLAMSLRLRSVSMVETCEVPLPHHRFVGGVAVGGVGFLPMPAETVSRCS
jgi:hypothetical protein